MAKNILRKIKQKAIGTSKHIVFPEGSDERIILAADKILKEKIAAPILLGDDKEIKKIMAKLKINSSKFRIISPKNSNNLPHYAQQLYELRKHKGLSKQEALKLAAQPNYFSTMMVHLGEADGLVSGAVYTTVDTLRPALQIVKTKPGVKLASSFFMMVLHGKAYFFSDCALVRYPDSEQLSEIAITTALSAEKFGIKPKVALLSYSTKGSGFGDSVDIVRKATEIAKKKRPDLIIDGEMQLDAAIVPEVAAIKCPRSPIKGNANVLIFPNLDAGNIGHKLVHRLAHAQAIGPVVQGLNKPINDLSRGCSVEDIVNITAITVMMALEEKNKKPHFKSEKHLLARGI